MDEVFLFVWGVELLQYARGGGHNTVRISYRHLYVRVEWLRRGIPESTYLAGYVAMLSPGSCYVQGNRCRGVGSSCFAWAIERRPHAKR